MYFSSVALENYKSFYERETVELEPGINFLVGPNNSGKTAILKRLEMGGGIEPHRSPQSMPEHGDEPVGDPNIQFSFVCPRPELVRVCLNSKRIEFRDPTGEGGTGKFKLAAEHWLQTPDEFEFLIGGPEGEEWTDVRALGYHERLGSDLDTVAFDASRQNVRFELMDRIPSLEKTGAAKQGLRYHPVQLAVRQLRSNIYRFDAVRPVGAVSKVEATRSLDQNAANLAACIQNLGGESDYNQLNGLLNEVFPQIEEVRSEPRGENRTQVKIRKFTGRPDLDIPLGQCGSGIAQVLAILYLLVTSNTSRTILIDEPASFLHPDAARALMEILQDFAGEHQFVIATHSPVILSSVRDASVAYVGIEDGVSFTEQIDPSDNQHLQRVLGGLGTKLSDIFGAEQIIWAEGPTEEQCLPLIIDEMCKNGMPYGTIVRDVDATGDFEGGDAERVFKIYENLSDGHALLPTGVAYIFDREDKDEQDVQDLERLGKDGPHDEESRIHLIDSRMYENYLLHPHALHHAIQNAPVVPEDLAEHISVDAVQERFDEVLSKRWLDFCERTDTDDSDDDARKEWRCRELHAADAIQEVLDGWRLTHHKPTYGRLMTEWLLENDRQHLEALAKQLDGILDQIDPQEDVDR